MIQFSGNFLRTDMEEVDKIIIDSLRHLNCNIDEEVTTLKNFDADIVVSAISNCLEAMNPQIKLPKKLPSSMSARIKFASSLAQQIKEFGFKGDMGYQTILYCNEVEVRRVLMFLIERLPKESSPSATIEPTGYIPRVVKQIEDTLKESLTKMWLPTELLHYGMRNTESGFILNSCGHSIPFDIAKIIVSEKEEASYIPLITKQCSSKQLIPSLLFQDALFSNSKEVISKIHITKDISQEILENIPISSKSVEQIAQKSVEKKENREDDLVNKLRAKRDALVSLQQVIEGNEEKLAKLISQKTEEQKLLKDSVAKVKVKHKTFAVLSNEENKVRLKNLIQKSQNRLVELANQWNEVQVPLLEEHRGLKSSLSSESLKHELERNKLESLRKNYKEMVADFKEKSILEQNLIERCKELNNKNNRAAYTKRILEIVGNIQKQNKEIQKILSDTRQVQKDISNLTGQVDRSFTLCDELIFHDCKQDESARKAYKFLAALREECNGILQAVSDMGRSERELRNLEEQVETEKSKSVRDKLDKVQSDLEEIQKEMKLLL